MEKYVEIVLRGSDSETLKGVINNPIIEFNIELVTSDISKIEDGYVLLSKEIYNKNIKLEFDNELNKLNEFIKKGYNIRIWTSHYNADSYMLLMYICNYIENKVEKIEVVYADEYDEGIYSIGCMKNEEIKKLLSFEHIYTDTELRIIEDKKIKLVSYDYFDNKILETLNKEQTSIISLAVTLSTKYYLSTTIIIFLIQRLIDNNKIKIIKQNEKNIQNIIDIK